MGYLSKIPSTHGLFAELESADTIDDLQGVSVSLRDTLGIDHVVYHWVNGNGDQYGCGTYPDAWVERYLEMGYLRIDPVILGCFQRFHPVDWQSLDWTSRAARAFREDAKTHGIGDQGYSIPIRGPNGQFALFTVNDSGPDESWQRFTAETRRDLILIAHLFNEKALDFEPGRAPADTIALSPREIDALTLLAVGYNRAAVAETLSISEHTLRVYIESARHKLGAMNTTHAVARALQRGVIVV